MGQFLYKTSHPFEIIDLKTDYWQSRDNETVLDLKLSSILLMKKTKQPASPANDSKGFLALAGEAFHVLGEEILEGKDKVVEVASEKFTAVKKAIQKATHRKTAQARGKVKKAAPKKIVKKAVAKKVVKKAVKKAAPKAVKKAAPKKVVKKAVPKKAVKKAAPKKAVKKTAGKGRR